MHEFPRDTNPLPWKINSVQRRQRPSKKINKFLNGMYGNSKGHGGLTWGQRSFPKAWLRSRAGAREEPAQLSLSHSWSLAGPEEQSSQGSNSRGLTL